VKPIIFDTGPLVAWLCPRDRFHAWSTRIFEKIQGGEIICEAVLTEVCHLVARDGIAATKVVDFVMEGGFRIVSLTEDLVHIQKMMERYNDTPMDFADACVTRLAEMHGGATVCTTDSDFQHYRIHRNQPIPLPAPFTR